MSKGRVIILTSLLFMAAIGAYYGLYLPRQPITYTLSEPVKVTNTGSFEENWVSLCPINETKLITRSIQEKGAVSRYRIGILSEDGTFTQLTPVGDFEDVKPTWSPDCSKIAFERLEGDLTNVYVMNADGSDLHQAMDMIPAGIHVYAPHWSTNPNILVVTLSDCTKCVPEPYGSHTQFGLVHLNEGGKTYILDNPPFGWGYMNNAAFDDGADAMIFNVQVGANIQIGRVTNVSGGSPKWELLTDESFNHIRPVYLPTFNTAFVFTGQVNGRLDVYLFYNGRSYNLTNSFGPCKDPDIRRLRQSFQIVAACIGASGHSDFVSFDIDLGSLVPLFKPLQ